MTDAGRTAMMEPTVRYRERILGGLRQRALVIEGTLMAGAASEQSAGGWAWFLRHPDGALAGEGGAVTWEGVLSDIRDVVTTEGKRHTPGPRDTTGACDGHPATRWPPGGR